MVAPLIIVEIGVRVRHRAPGVKRVRLNNGATLPYHASMPLSSHPTEGSNGRGRTFWARICDRLTSLNVELSAVVKNIISYCLFQDQDAEALVGLRERMPSKSCFG